MRSAIEFQYVIKLENLLYRNPMERVVLGVKRQKLYLKCLMSSVR